MANVSPVIGIVPSFDEGFHIPSGGGNVHRLYMRHEYSRMLATVGAVPLILNQNMPLDYIVATCDGIVISGGEDIDPVRYDQTTLAGAYRRPYEPAERFDWETKLIDACDAADQPILGICYGLQRLNVHYGGSLLQDIGLMVAGDIGHEFTTHLVTFQERFLGMSGSHVAASRHHQAIDRLADGFRAVARSNDGVIEAIAGRGHFGMQWHPESDATGAHVYRAFVEQAIARRGDRVDT